MRTDLKSEEISHSDFRAIIREGLRDLTNCFVLEFSIENLPEFIVCLNGSFVTVKIKGLVDKEDSMTGDVRDSGGLCFEVTRHNWVSVLKSLEFLADGRNSFRN